MARNRGEYIPADPKWTPFVQLTERQARENNRFYDTTQDGECWVNSRYRVYRRTHQSDQPEDPELWHLSIRRLDGRPVRRWRDLQRMKNEFFGPEAFAWETFPPESILVDTSDQFHLWHVPGLELPTPFCVRLVANAPAPGGHQTPWEPGETPPDTLDTHLKLKRRMEEILATCGDQEGNHHE